MPNEYSGKQKIKVSDALQKLIANNESTELLAGLTKSMGDFVQCHEQLVAVVASNDGAAIGQAMIDHIRQSAVVLAEVVTTVATIGTVLDDIKIVAAQLHMADMCLETDRLHQHAEYLRSKLGR